MKHVHKRGTISEAEARRRIETLDLSCVAWKLYEKKEYCGFRWTLRFIKEVEHLYRAYLFVCWKYPNEKNVPSVAMDEFWHNHILFTAKYKKDCQHIFGYYLEHDPTFGVKPITEKFKQSYETKR